MDDEIDIEEHDVLEDPRLRNIFPDLSQIKVEIPDDDFEDQSMDHEPYSETEEISNHQESEESAEYTRHGNKIILGSKPILSASKVSENTINATLIGAKAVTVKQEPLHDSGNDGILGEDEYSQSSSVIIVGSKPCKTGVIEPIRVNDTGNYVSEPVSIDKPLDIVTEHDSEDYVIKDSVVLLENWGPVLQNSSCFCKECEILFPTTNTLHAHNNIAHSLLVVVDKNKAVKSTAKKQDMESGKFCNHCNKIFPDSDSLISHLYENMKVKPTANTLKTHLKPNPFHKAFEALTPQKNLPTPVRIENKPQPLSSGSVTTYSHKYKCVICSEIFLNYAKARIHRNLKHSELNGHVILKKITYSSKTPSVAIKKVGATFAAPKKTAQISSKQPQIMPKVSKPSPAKLSEISPSKIIEGQMTISQALVPISVLFKCDKCDIHFTSCYPAIQHAKSCPEKPGEWTCEICNLQFKSWGRVMHNLQHKYSDKFTVYTCHENIEGKVLNYCPDCNSYLHEKDFFLHRRSGQSCHKNFIKCNSCLLPIHSTSAKEHSKWHAITKMSVKNMILVTFMKTDEVKVATGPVKRQLQMDDTPIGKKAKVDAVENKQKKMLVLYCQICNSFLFNARHKEAHASGVCVNSKKFRVVCKICGLVCHKNHKYQKICERVNGNVSDMKFISIRHNKAIYPPIPQYPKCKKCKVHFCSTMSVASHDCNESHKTCKYCKEKFSDLAHKLHVRFHLLHLKSSNASSVQPLKLIKPSNVNPPKVNLAKKDQFPDLLKKYQMLTNGLHIIFRCETCDIACDSYDKAVEHSQKHYNNMESYDVIVNPCEICDLKFDSTSYDGHMTLHDQDQKLDKQSFHIIQYEYNNLFNKDWNNILGELPAAQVEQILATSIYRYAKSVKLRIVEEGPPEATLYKCEKCKAFIHPKSLTFHYRTAGCENENRKSMKCRHCYRPMSTPSTKLYHENMHKAYSSFQIVYFNEEGDEEFNQNLRVHETRHIPFSNLPKNGYFNYFICEKCKCCIVSSNSKDHRCAKIFERTRCAKCQLYFSNFYITKHMKIHEMYPRLCKKYIKLTSFKPAHTQIRKETLNSPRRLLNPSIWRRPATSTAEKDVDLYKCVCGLHFTTFKAAEKHFSLCNTKLCDASTEKCSKCDLLFDTTQLVTHLCKHHSNGNDKNTNFKIAPVQKHYVVHLGGFKLWKCVKCNVHFTSNTSLKRHFTENHLMKKVATCPHCKLIFRPYSLKKHISKHHKSGSAKPSLKLKFGTAKTLKTTTKYLKRLQKSGYELKKIYGKVLYKCRECKQQTLFLTLKSLYSHYGRRLHNRPIQQCEECHYSFLMHGSSLSVHKYVHHKLMKLKRGDFQVRVPGEHQAASDTDNSEAVSQNSTDVDDPEPIKTVSLINQPKHRSLARKSTTKSIVTLNRNQTNVKKSLSNTPSEDDKTNTVDNTSDIISDGKRKYKFFNVLYKCELCEAHFCTGSHVVKHVNDIHVKSLHMPSVETCHCGLSFNKFIISRHQQMHHEKQDLTAADFYIVPVTRYENTIGHKYLFRCGVCKLNYMKLSRLEEHMNHVEHYLGKSRCQKCHLAFLPSTMNAHIALHHDILNLSTDDFVVMESVGDDSIALADGMEMDTAQNDKSPFTDTDIKQKLETLDNFNSRKRTGIEPHRNDLHDQFIASPDFESIKNKIQQLAKTSLTDAAAEYLKHIEGNDPKSSEITEKSKICLMRLYKKIYKCKVCDTHYPHMNCLRKHVKNSCPDETVSCIICNLKISVNSLVSHVKYQHKIFSLTRDDFVITDTQTDINGDSSIADDTCELQEESVIDSEKDNISILSIEDSNLTDSKDDVDPSDFHHCDKCSCNFLCRKSLIMHKANCKDEHDKYQCPICQLFFTKYSLGKHTRRDHKETTLEKSVPYQSKSVRVSTVSRVDKNKTKVLNKRTLEKKTHVRSREVRVCTVSRDYTDRSNNLHRCEKCSCNFLTRSSLDHHRMAYCNDDLQIYQCPVCELFFTKVSVNKHMRRDHKGITLKKSAIRCQSKEDSNMTFTNENTESNGDNKRYTLATCLDESETPEELLTRLDLLDSFHSTMNLELYNNELHKCDICPLHFFTSYALSRHLLCYKYGKHTGCDVMTCKFCEKQFTGKVIAKHVYIHHLKLNISKDGFKIFDPNGEEIKTNVSIIEIVDEPKNHASAESTDHISQDSSSEISSKDDNVNENADEPNEIAEKISTSNTDLYSNKLFKCSLCNLHFLTTESWQWHVKNALHSVRKTNCTVCGLEFTDKTLATHVFIHHDKLNLMKEHFLISCSVNDENEEAYEDSNELPADAVIHEDDVSTKDEANNFNQTGNKDFELASTSYGNMHRNTESITTNIPYTQKTDENEEHREVVDTTDKNLNDVVLEALPEKSPPKSDRSTPESKNSSVSNEILVKLYKCAACNVCYLNQTTCYKHVVKHTSLNSKDFIECKLCGYQFMIIFLHKHIWKHHNRVFKPEDVLIEEYHPNVLCHGTPKIEIYYGSDKVQSKLVSTTSEGNASEEIDDEDIAVIESNDEIRLDNLDNNMVVAHSENTQHQEGIVKELSIEGMDID